MGLRVCHLGPRKGKEEEKECAHKFATHCYEMITDGIARFAKKWEVGSFFQSRFGLAGEDEASGHMRLIHGLIHIERKANRRGEMIANVEYQKKMKRW